MKVEDRGHKPCHIHDFINNCHLLVLTLSTYPKRIRVRGRPPRREVPLKQKDKDNKFENPDNLNPKELVSLRSTSTNTLEWTHRSVSSFHTTLTGVGEITNLYDWNLIITNRHLVFLHTNIFKQKCVNTNNLYTFKWGPLSEHYCELGLGRL